MYFIFINKKQYILIPLVLFFGGFYRIKIEGLRLMETKQNFEEFIGALWIFDAMITGSELKGIKVSKKDILIIKGLLEHSLNKAASTTFDNYIYSTFAAFVQHKKQISLHLDGLYGADKGITDLMMYPLERRDYEEESVREYGDFSNLFKAEIFGIFPNIKTLIIQSTDAYGEDSYSLCMTGLLSLIESLSFNQVIIKAVTRFGYNWIESLCKSPEKMIKEYAAKNYIISMKNRENECWFVT